ncbi:rhodanese-like domain-containing protein [Shewanella gaetbuli]|uniref:Rhodanese-like domain-containing protein n=1 Tax=Shewanella gaetbuli TaxID=220752 RepID=A0A9X1ZPA5_9GAMM|nr:rhodanese-like domain-containing protein [Shewanella gaetbuli]
MSYLFIQKVRAQSRLLKRLLLSALMTGVLGLSAHVNAKDINAESAWKQIEQQAVVIDVRTANEFAAGHIEGAINIPFEEIVEGVNALNLTKDSPIVLYCRSGRRSGIADNALTEAGYSQSMNAGGFNALVEAKP